ncbi:hypothetical protein QQX98_004094 [Neonectria punicea]|uniref:WW domain-containing oxidoreductase n=1 Tax=Neonectria punicea TaxID=979145 RepID=A0ABR1HAG3_9HYPO
MSRYAAAHANPQGPGDARPKVLPNVKDEGLVGQLSDKVALVTGANSGIGLETARALHATGATIFLTARSSAKAQEARDSILARPGSKSDAPIHTLELRLDSLESVRAAAKSFLSQSTTPKLHLLILNAGVMATPEGRTEGNFETQFGTNHLGHFLLFQLLKPTLLSSTSPESSFQARVVVLTSMGHRAGPVRFHDWNFEKEAYDPLLAYGQSKTANIYTATEIEKRYGPQGLHSLSLHPGVIFTNLGRHFTDDQMAALDWGESVQRRVKSIPQGAATTIYAALSKDWEGRGGRYLSNCTEELPIKPDADYASGEDGYATWAYEDEKSATLWDLSCKLVGLENNTE